MRKKYSAEEVLQWEMMREVGFNYYEISRILGVAESAVHYCLDSGYRERKKEYNREYYRRPEIREFKKKYSREYYRGPGIREHRRKCMREYYRAKQITVLSAWRKFNGWLTENEIMKRTGTLRDFKETLPLLETKEQNGTESYKPKDWVLRALNSV